MERRKEAGVSRLSVVFSSHIFVKYPTAPHSRSIHFRPYGGRPGFLQCMPSAPRSHKFRPRSIWKKKRCPPTAREQDNDTILLAEMRAQGGTWKDIQERKHGPQVESVLRASLELNIALHSSFSSVSFRGKSNSHCTRWITESWEIILILHSFQINIIDPYFLLDALPDRNRIHSLITFLFFSFFFFQKRQRQFLYRIDS